MGLSTPTVIYGRNFQTRSAGNQEWTVVPFLLEGERLCVQLCLAPNPDAEEDAKRGISDSSRAADLEEQRVRRAPPYMRGTASRRAPVCASSLEERWECRMNDKRRAQWKPW